MATKKLGTVPGCAHMDLWPYIAYDNRYIVRYLECVECGYRAMLNIKFKHKPYSCANCRHEWVEKSVRCPKCGTSGFVHHPRFPTKHGRMSIKSLDGKMSIPDIANRTDIANTLFDRIDKRH